MGTFTKAVVTLAVLVGMTTASATSASASPDLAYLHDDTIEYSAPEWMGHLADTTALNAISIPGTHDTMSTGPGGDATQNQSLSLATQLESGIRFLDIRLRKKASEDELYLHHGPVYLNATIGDVLRTVSAFLAAHPSETILMRTKQEYSNEPSGEYGNALNSHLAPFVSQLWSNEGSGVQTPLGSLRGKMVLLNQDAADIIPWGMPYGLSSSIQDNYHLVTVSDQYKKWVAAKMQLDSAQQNTRVKGPTLYLNYLSGSGGALPYFVASGKIGPGTYARQLSTGLTTPAFKSSYPDFPRTGCFIGVCTISYEGTNRLATDHIVRNQLTGVGIVIADFPGPALIRAIVDANQSTASHG